MRVTVCSVVRIVAGLFGGQSIKRRENKRAYAGVAQATSINRLTKEPLTGVRSTYPSRKTRTMVWTGYHHSSDETMVWPGYRRYP